MKYNPDEIFGKAIGIIAHDFRNYLNTIIGFSSILENDPVLNNETRGFVKKISQAGTLIEKLLSNIDDYVADDFEIEYSSVNIKSEITNFVNSWNDFYKERKIIIEDFTENDLNIITSSNIFNKVLENLFSFSIKGLRGKKERFIQIYCKKENNRLIMYYSDASNPISIKNNYFNFDEMLNAKRGLAPLFIEKYLSLLNGETKYVSGNRWNDILKKLSKKFKTTHGFIINIPNME